jgi:hypothetical protein
MRLGYERVRVMDESPAFELQASLRLAWHDMHPRILLWALAAGGNRVAETG